MPLYRNSIYKTVLKEQANKDIDNVIAEADTLDLNSKWKDEAAKTTIITAFWNERLALNADNKSDNIETQIGKTYFGSKRAECPSDISRR